MSILKTNGPIEDFRAFMEDPDVLAFLHKVARKKAPDDPEEFNSQIILKLMDDDFAIGTGAKKMPFGFEFRTQVEKIIDLAVKD